MQEVNEKERKAARSYEVTDCSQEGEYSGGGVRSSNSSATNPPSPPSPTACSALSKACGWPTTAYSGFILEIVYLNNAACSPSTVSRSLQHHCPNLSPALSLQTAAGKKTPRNWGSLLTNSTRSQDEWAWLSLKDYAILISAYIKASVGTESLTAPSVWGFFFSCMSQNQQSLCAAW